MIDPSDVHAVVMAISKANANNMVGYAVVVLVLLGCVLIFLQKSPFR